MGNRPQKVGPQLLVFGQHRRLFLFTYVAAVLKRQSTLAENGQQNAFLKRVKWNAVNMDAYNAVHCIVDANGEIQAFCASKSIRCSAGVLIVFQYPCRHRLFIFRHKLIAFFSDGKDERVIQAAAVYGIYRHVPA